MFGSFDVFSMFSRIRFRESYHFSARNNSSSQDQISSSIAAPTANCSAPATELQPIAQTTPADKIDLSSDSANSPQTEKPVTYTVPPAITPETNDSQSEIDETPDTNKDPEAPPEKQLIGSKSSTKIDLKMVFNLRDFQRLVTAVAEDAQDGQLDSTSYSNLSLGFHSEMNAQAKVKETYKLANSQDDSTQVQKDSSKYGNLEASLIKSRGFEASSFYRESLKTSSKIKESSRDGFLHVARKLSVRYSQDFHLNMRTMSKFNSQSTALDKTGDLQAYLGNTEALVDSPQTSGELIGQFFDTVDQYLSGAEDKLIAKVEDFMNNLASEMGISSDSLDSLKDSLVNNIRGFFDKVDQAISSVKTNYIKTQPENVDTIPAIIPKDSTPIETIPIDTTPQLVDTAEAVAAA